jgi:hypothetical protein
MIVIVIGTAVGSVIGLVLWHYFGVGLRKALKKDRRYDLPRDE